jgi:hypothetical protein
MTFDIAWEDGQREQLQLDQLAWLERSHGRWVIGHPH